MIYTVTHRTHYRYANSAIFSQHLMRLSPRTTRAQLVLDAKVAVTPDPDTLGTQTDMFGNTAHVATVSRPHAALEIVATSRIERQPPDQLILAASEPWETARDAGLGTPQRLPDPGVAIYAFPSAMTEANPQIEAYARESLTQGRPLLEAAEELCHRIYEDFEYVPGATAADTLPVESFGTKKGVCQDFAHVMLACLRALRVPARYVSGYLRTTPPPGVERLQGADATHAWVAVWDPVFDWVEFDPTNDIVPGLDHITLAWGRDYADVSPVSGLVIGAGRQTLSVGVDVAPLADPAQAALALPPRPAR